jgi:phage gp29-like protein
MASPQTLTARPVIEEIVTREVLRYQGLNAQAFSGSMNPSSIYRIMVDGLGQVFPFYREVEEKDLTIASSLEVRKLLVQARQWNVVGADEENGQAALYKDEASAFLNSIPGFSFVLEELLDAAAYGYAVAEIMWKIESNRVGVEKIIGRPQEFFDFRQAMLDPPLGDLRFLPDMIIPGQEVPQSKFLVSTYKPRHGDRRGLPLLRKLYWASWFKRQGLRLDLQFLEKGQGTVAVQYSDSADSSEKEKALVAAQAIVDEVAVAVPSSVKLLESLLTGTRRREGKDYQALLDYLDSEMTRIVLGQTLTTRGSEQQRGTQALGEVHQDLLFEIVKRDSGQLSEVIDEQLLRPWGLWTFGPAFLDRAFRPHFMIDVEPEEDVLGQARILKEARGLVDVPRAEAYRRLQIPEPEEGEALVNEPFTPVELGGIGQ